MLVTSPAPRESGIDREVPLNDFMREGAGAQAELQDLIDRMFNAA